MESYLNHINSVLDSNVPFKKVNKYKLKFKIKPWITLAIQKSVSVKKYFLKKFMNYIDSQTKEHLHTRFKDFRNLLFTLLKSSKMNYKQYFDISWNNIENTWKGTKSVLNFKYNLSAIPNILSANDSTIIFATICNNCFFRWGTHLYMSLFLSVGQSICPSVHLSVCLLCAISQEPYII